MQTFVPIPDFALSAKSLDDKRLGKQRVETLQILNALTGLSKGWTNHPATRMWRGHERALTNYGLAICEEWIHRGFNDSCHAKISLFYKKFSDTGMPDWWNDDRVHDSHKSNLMRKFPLHYDQFDWEVSDDLPYYWPTCNCRKHHHS